MTTARSVSTQAWTDSRRSIDSERRSPSHASSCQLSRVGMTGDDAGRGQPGHRRWPADNKQSRSAPAATNGEQPTPSHQSTATPNQCSRNDKVLRPERAPSVGLSRERHHKDTS